MNLLPNNRLIRKIYRSLIRLSKSFEANPVSKNFLYRKRIDFESLTVIEDARDYYNEITAKIFCGRSYFYRHDGQKSLISIVQEEFKNVEVDVDESCRIDVALKALKKFSTIWQTFERDINPAVQASRKIVPKFPGKLSLHIMDVNAVRAGDITPGLILVAHPLVHGPFKRSVVLILDSTPSGSYGVVINRFESHSVASGVRNLPNYATDAFGRSRISFGGMIRRLQVIHSLSECGGVAIPSCEDTRLFFDTDLKKASRLVADNPELRSQFRFFVGCCVWTPVALRDELEAGYWLPCKAPPDTLLKLSSQHLDNEPTNGTSAQETLSTTSQSMDVHSKEDMLWARIISELPEPSSAFAVLPPMLDSSIIAAVDW